MNQWAENLIRLIINDSYLSLLVTTQLKVLASLDGQHSLGSAVGLHTLKPQHNFLCCLGLEGAHSKSLTHTNWFVFEGTNFTSKNVELTFLRKIGFVWPP